MAGLSAPLELLMILAALAWPVAAGLGGVLWTTTRAAERQRRRTWPEAGTGRRQRPTPRTLAGARRAGPEAA